LKKSYIYELIDSLKNEFSSFFRNQSNLRATSLYFILSIALQSLSLILAIRSYATRWTDPNLVLDDVFKLLQIGTGIWIVIRLLSSNRKEQDYMRLIGLYLLFSISYQIIRLPAQAHMMVILWRANFVYFSFLHFLFYPSTMVITILSTYISFKLLRKQIDQTLFLILSINPIMYIIRLLDDNWDFINMLIRMPGMEAIVYLIGFCTSLVFYSILTILFLEISGKIHFFHGDEKRVIKWVGVALFLKGFSFASSFYLRQFFFNFFDIVHSQGFSLVLGILIPIILGIQAITLIYLSIRVRA